MIFKNLFAKEEKMGEEKQIIQGKLYTTNEVGKMLREALAEIVAETTKDEDGNMGMVELIVGAKLIGKFEEKIGETHK